MNRKSAFVGPVKFDIRLPENSPVEDFPESFRHPVWDVGERAVSAVYEVEVSFLDPDPAAGGLMERDTLGKKVFENEEVAEYVDGNIITRLHLCRILGEIKAFMRVDLQGNRIRMYVPDAAHWPIGRKREIWAYLMLEKLLLREDAIILHSASIIYGGGAILFTAPSGTGKSTQADLWKKYEGAVGFNGDRNILMKRDGLWIVCGLPWSGTSPDHLNEVHPLRAIAVIRQAEEDSVGELPVTEKILHISEGVTMNRWNRAFLEKAFDLMMPLVQEAVIILLDCTMKRSAMECLGHYLESADRADQKIYAEKCNPDGGKNRIERGDSYDERGPRDGEKANGEENGDGTL